MNKFKYVVTAALLLNGFVSNAAVIYASETLDAVSLETQEVKEVSEVDPNGTASNQAEDLEETLDTSIVNSTEVADEEIEVPILEEVPANQQDTAENREQETTMSSEESPTIIYSGTFGTSDWRIVSDGTLYIGEGEFADTNGLSPWYSYREFIKRIEFEGPATAAANSSHLFSSLYRVTTIDKLDYLDTSKVTDMSGMFRNTHTLTNLDLSNFDTTRVTDMSYMFYYTRLTSLNLSSFNTSQVTNMSYMFYYTGLTSLDLSSFVTSQVTNMSNMFAQSGSLTSLNLSKFDTSQVTNMSYMFHMTSRLIELDVTNFITKQVTNMTAMFSHAGSIKTLNLSNFDTSKVTNMSYMFSGTNSIENLNLSNFDTSKVTNMREMFNGASSLETLDLFNFDTSQVTDMWGIFNGVNNLRSLRLGSNFTFIHDNSMIGLVEPPVNDIYTGKWQNVGTGTTDQPKGEHIFDSSADFVAKYDGATMADTFVWQQTPNHESISAIDSTLFVGDTWNPKDNFVSATNRAGAPVAFEDITVVGEVNTSIPREYPVTFTNGQSKQTITVTVVPDQESISAKDSTLFVGDTWNPKDNFVSATNRAGAPVAFEHITVVGEVNTSIPGEYPVTFTNGKSEQTITVTVIPQPEYFVRGDNFVVHKDDVDSTLDILDKSNAYAGNLADNTDVVAPIIISSSLKPEVGVYEVVLGIDKDETIQTTILVFVIDDNTGRSNNHVLFANNFEMPHSERHTLTHELVHALGKIEAYEIYNGNTVSNLVEVNTDDLAAIQTAPESGVYPVQLTLLAPTPAREQLQLTIYVTLTDDEEKEPEKEPEKENGPETDPGNNEVEKENGPGSGNGSSNGNGGTGNRENVSNQIRPNNNRAAATRTLADRQSGRTAKPSDRTDSSKKLPKTGAVRTSSTLGILLVAASTSLYLWQKKKKN